MIVQKVDFLTVATLDYLPQALATLQSAKDNANYSNYHFFAIDASSDAIYSLQEYLNSEYGWIKVFGPHDLRTNRRLFLDSFKYFNPLELSCLAKYVGVAHIIEGAESADFCVYSDADIFFTANPIPALSEMGDAAILLTPHQFSPSSDSAEQEYLLYGWINAGFFVIARDAKGTQKIVDWLINRISRRGFLAPSIGLYVDQAWLSLVPAFFNGEVTISHNAGFNVAYWNLHERPLQKKAEVICVDDRELIFFHFSGFIGSPEMHLTKHCHSSIQGNSILQELCARYRLALTVAEDKISRLGSCEKMKICNKKIEARILQGSLVNDVNVQLTSSGYGFFYRIGIKIDMILFGLMKYMLIYKKKLFNK